MINPWNTDVKADKIKEVQILFTWLVFVAENQLCKPQICTFPWWSAPFQGMWQRQDSYSNQLTHLLGRRSTENQELLKTLFIALLTSLHLKNKKKPTHQIGLLRWLSGKGTSHQAWVWFPSATWDKNLIYKFKHCTTPGIVFMHIDT